MKNTGIVLLGLVCFGCASPYVPPTRTPMAPWIGLSGWTFDGNGARVLEGTRRLGEAFIEHDARFIRTGIVEERIEWKSANGTNLIIPAGAKAFAMNFTLVNGETRAKQAIDPTEWCVYLPQGVDGQKQNAETVCIFWESEDRARYFPADGLAFEPRLSSTSGMPGVVPKIRQVQVDFGFDFKRQIRVKWITKDAIAIESVFYDGVNATQARVDEFKWGIDGTLAYSFGHASVVIVPSEDRQSIEVRREQSRVNSVASEPLSMDFGRSCGSMPSHEELAVARVSLPRFTPKHPPGQPEYPAESRRRGEQGTVEMRMLVNESGDVARAQITRSSTYEALDKSVLHAARGWKIAPGSVNGKVRCMWQTFTFGFHLSD